MGIQFDVQAAKANGYSDSDIADAVGRKAGFDVAGARAAGYGDQDIISRLTTTVTPAVQAAPAAIDPNQGAKDLANNTGTMESVLVGAGRTSDRVVKGIKQLYYGATGNEKELADLKKQAEDDSRVYDPLQAAHPIATAVGESLPSMVVPVGAGGTALQAAGRLAVSGAVPNALEYGSVGERAGRAAAGAVGSTIGGLVVPKAISAATNGVKASIKGFAGNITPEAIALADRAKQLGIPVNAAQLGDSKFLKTLASSLEQMPFTGGASTAANQRTSFTKAVAKTFGSDAEKITPEVYAAEKKRLGQQFEDLSARNNLNVDDPLKTKLATIADQASSTADDSTVRAVNNIIERVTDQSATKGGNVPAQVSQLVGANGSPIVKAAASSAPVISTLPGAAYQSIDTELTNIIKGGGEKGLYAKRLQSAIREGMDASITPVDQAAWAETRGQYKNLKAVRDIVAKDSGSGNIPPTQLMNALNNSEAGKEAMAMGTRGTLGELGQIGKQFVRDAVPNSGTAQRAIAMGLIGGGGYAFGADPITIAGMAAGGATSGRLINKILTSPKTIEALGKKGISFKDLMKLPPSKIDQILGGLSGESTAERMIGN